MSRNLTPNTLTKTISMRELGALFLEYQRLSEADPMSIIPFHLAFSCALRKSEMLKIRWEHFDQQHSRLAIHETMRFSVRTAYVTKDLSAALDQIHESQKSGLLFPSPHAFRLYTRRLIKAGLNIRLETQPSFSMLRRCGIMYLVSAGISPMALYHAGIRPPHSRIIDMVPWIKAPDVLPAGIRKMLDGIFNIHATKTGQ